MKISVFGLGYVGVVSAACLASEGHEVVGVDPNRTKVDLINDGRSPIVEKDVDSRISIAVSARRLRATTDAADGIADSQLSLVCVGTPSCPNGSLDLRFLTNVCREIGEALRAKDSFHVVVIRSTVLPGTMRDVVIPTLEAASGGRAGQAFGVCNNPPRTVLGETDSRSGDKLLALYAGLSAPVVRTNVSTAEMVKYVDNVWHALKVGFANEIGTICKSLDLDGHEVMDIFCMDTKLNLSPSYLKPGFAFGGSCLPKDVRALTYRARTLDTSVPIIEAVLPSNELQIRRGLDLIMKQPGRRVGILGFSFKAGTDDLRESPVVELIERLLGKGYEIVLFDRNVNFARLLGANREFIEERIPYVERLMVDSIDEVIASADTIVIGNRDPEFATSLSKLKPEQRVVDLVRGIEPSAARAGYEGICW